MTTSYSFVTTFNQKISQPDAWDTAGGTATGGDLFFAELGKLAKQIQNGTLTAADAHSVKVLLQKFSDGVNRVNGWIAESGAVAGNADDAKFANRFKALAAEVNLLMQRISFSVDELAAGNSSGTQKFLANSSQMLKNVGGLIGLMQIGNELWKGGLTETGVDNVGAKSLGVLAGWAGAEFTALAVAGVLTVVGAPVVLTAAAALGSAVLVGYFAGKSGESAWPAVRDWGTDFFTSVFEGSGAALNLLNTRLSDLSVKMGKFDGTWLEGLDATPEQKAALTSLIVGVAKVPVSVALNADVKRLLEAPFEEEGLVSRDLLIKIVLSIAQDQNAYLSERVSVDESGVVTLNMPGTSTTTALFSLTNEIEKLLDPADRTHFTLTPPSKVLLAAAAGNVIGTSAEELLVGSAEADTLEGSGGRDVLVAGGGNDVLRGGSGMDDLFGGAGDDILDGGAGGDYLYGGAGSDRYELRSGELFDVIKDSDGNGTIWVDGTQLTGGKKRADDYWISEDSEWGFLLTGSGDLVISKGSSLDRITIRNWQSAGGNQLGITLDDSEAPQPEPSRTFTGDFAKKIDPDDDERYLIGDDGNYVADGSGPGALDLITGTSENDDIDGLDGDDALLGRGGDDLIQGGEGNDVLMGGLGADTLKGGAGRDLIYGSSMGSLLYPNSVDYELNEASLPISLGRGFSWHMSTYGPDSEGFDGGYLTWTVSRDLQFGDDGNVIGLGVLPIKVVQGASLFIREAPL